MIDRAAFRALSYGLYLITSVDANGHKVGCVANTLQQVTSEPPQISVALNKENATTGVILDTGRFGGTVLSQNASMELIGAFGYRTSYEFDKFNQFEHGISDLEIPYIVQHGVATFSARVVQKLDVGTHIIFIGQVEEAKVLSADTPMTYAYYHEVKGGKTPPKAPSYNADEASQPSQAASQAKDDVYAAVHASVAAEHTVDPASLEDPEAVREEMNDLEVIMAEEVANAIEAGEGSVGKKYAWQCTVCGYIEYMDELPDDYTCPVCGAPKDMFVRIEV